MNLETIEIKAFVPARDLAESLACYKALGFESTMESDGLARLSYGKTAFLLSHYYNPEHANNFVMHACRRRRRLVPERSEFRCCRKFPVRTGPPDDRPWGIRDFTLIDPTGVLWRIGHLIPA